MGSSWDTAGTGIPKFALNSWDDGDDAKWAKKRSPGRQLCYRSRSDLPGNLGVVFLGRICKKSNPPGIWDIIIFTITHPMVEAETCRTAPGAGDAVGNWEALTQTGPF